MTYSNMKPFPLFSFDWGMVNIKLDHGIEDCILKLPFFFFLCYTVIVFSTFLIRN